MRAWLRLATLLEAQRPYLRALREAEDGSLLEVGVVEDDEGAALAELLHQLRGGLAALAYVGEEVRRVLTEMPEIAEAARKGAAVLNAMNGGGEGDPKTTAGRDT